MIMWIYMNRVDLRSLKNPQMIYIGEEFTDYYNEV